MAEKTGHFQICHKSKDNFVAFLESKISKIMNTWYNTNNVQ